MIFLEYVGSRASLSAKMQLSAKRWAVFIFPSTELARAWEKIWFNVKSRLFCIFSVTGTQAAIILQGPYGEYQGNA